MHSRSVKSTLNRFIVPKLGKWLKQKYAIYIPVMKSAFVAVAAVQFENCFNENDTRTFPSIDNTLKFQCGLINNILREYFWVRSFNAGPLNLHFIRSPDEFKHCERHRETFTFGNMVAIVVLSGHFHFGIPRILIKSI